MHKLLITLLLLILTGSTFAQFRVSDNKHYLLRDGKPFFWMGDTAWELFHRLNREQADYYLKRRAEQGYTVIQAVALAEFDGLHVPNPNGDLPLNFDDPTQPNEKYFKHVDYIIDKAAEYGLVIGFLPTWGDKVFKDVWGKDPRYLPLKTPNGMVSGWAIDIETARISSGFWVETVIPKTIPM